jgi:hypothetical protein
LVDCVAVPEVNVSVPREEVPLSNATVPVAELGLTVAVKVTAAPRAGVVVDAMSVVAEAPVPLIVTVTPADVLAA